VNTDKVAVTVDTMCESPLYEGIVHKTQRSHPDLVIRSVGGTETLEPGVLSATDWHLVRTSPVPLMLVRGNPWRQPPRLAAAIDVTDQPGLTQAILRAGAWLAQRCEGSLEILHADSTITADEVTTGARRAQVCEQVSAAGVQAQHVHVVPGDPAIALPTFAASRRYDMVILGALTHRKVLTDLVGTLTGRLIQALDCDFLLVKPAGFVCPVTPR
jgi:universal stress protein E